MRETLELLDDLLGEGLYKIGDKYIDIPNSKVAGSTEDLKSYLAGGDYKVYKDQNDLISSKFSGPPVAALTAAPGSQISMFGAKSLKSNVPPRYDEIIKIFQGVNNEAAREKGLAVILDEDYIPQIVIHLSNSGSLELPKDMTAPVEWSGEEWVKRLYQASDLSREGAVGDGELLSCAYFSGISMAEGGESNTATVDIAGNGHNWSVKSGNSSAGIDGYKVNGKLESFKTSLDAKISVNNSPFGLKVKELMKGQKVINKDTVMTAIYADNSGLSHENENELQKLTALASEFWKKADEAVNEMSLSGEGGGFSYLFVSPKNFLAVQPKEGGSILRFRGTTQDKVTISASVGKSPYTISFTKDDWAAVAPGMKGSGSFRKSQVAVLNRTNDFSTAWKEFTNAIDANDLTTQKYTKVKTESQNLNTAIDSWIKNAGSETSVTQGKDSWFTPSAKYDALKSLIGKMTDLGSVPTKKSDKDVFLAKLKTMYETLPDETKNALFNIESGDTAGGQWFRKTQENAGRSRPGPRLMETLSLLEDLLTP